MPDPAETGDLTIVRADTDGDSAIVAHTAALPDPSQAIVVTADRELRDRVGELGATVASPSTLLGALDGLG